MTPIRLAAVLVGLILAAPPARADAIEEQHRHCSALQQRLQALKSELPAEHDSLEAARRALARKRAVLEARRQELDQLRPPPIDYSKYDRCPLGNGWFQCGHTELKERWRLEQLGDYVRQKRLLGEEVRVDESDFRAELDQFQRRLNAYRSKQQALTDGVVALRQELDRLHGLVRQRVAELEDRRQRSRAALQRVQRDLPETSKALEEWTAMSREARDDAAWTGLSALASLVLFEKKMAIRKGDEIADLPVKLRRIENELFGEKFKLYENPQLREALKEKYMAVAARLRNVRNAEDLLHTIQRDQEFASLTAAVSKGQKAEVAAAFLKLFVKDARVSVLLDEGEFAVAVGYAHAVDRVSRQELDRLLALGEDQLTEIRNYSRVLVDDTRQLHKLRTLEQSLQQSK